MSKNSDRRSVSLRGSTYRRLAVKVAELDRSASGYLEELLEAVLEGIPDPGTNMPAVRACDSGPREPRGPKPKPKPQVSFEDLEEAQRAFFGTSRFTG